jgi:hypothetical protein
MPIPGETTSVLDATRARDAWSDTLNRAAFGKERLVLHRRGKPIAALIPIEDLQLLERLIEEIEDQMDLAEVERRLANPEGPPVNLEALRARLGL